MEVNLILSVTKEEFFDFLTLSILNDIKESTGKSLKEQDIIKGLNFKKSLNSKLGREGKVKVIIKEFVYGERYQVSFKSNQGENTLTYSVQEIENDSIRVEYSEGFIGADKIKGLNFSIVSFFYNWKAKKDATQILRNIERYIIQNRKELEND